jgi:hypothetical protein
MPDDPAFHDGDEGARLPFELLAQPNDSTCGPTCLHGVYRFFGDKLPLEEVISGVQVLPSGGTLAVSLGCHALRRGYRATIYTCNVQIFDPTWFAPGVSIPDKLRAQREVKRGTRLSASTEAYLDFFSLGGRLRYEDLNSALFRRYLRRGVPILTGLSATHLYGCSRELEDGGYDDVRGGPVGHFVVLSGYDPVNREVLVADPLENNPGFGTQNYRVKMDRLIAAILLGIVTYDANLLVIEPLPRKPAP